MTIKLRKVYSEMNAVGNIFVYIAVLGLIYGGGFPKNLVGLGVFIGLIGSVLFLIDRYFGGKP